MAQIRLMKTGHGDIELAEWTQGDDISLANAKSVFAKEMTPGRMAFRVYPDHRTELLKEMIGDEERILIVPAVAGGMEDSKTLSYQELPPEVAQKYDPGDVKLIKLTEFQEENTAVLMIKIDPDDPTPNNKRRWDRWQRHYMSGNYQWVFTG